MNWYKNNKQEWKNIILTIANDLRKNPLMIEKDIIQSMILFRIAKSDLPFVFKGGTSLSKAYNLIDRFSEDIDLSMSKKITSSEKRKSKDIIINSANELGLLLKNPNDVQSRFDYNKYIFEYDSFFSNEKLEIIVETSYYQIAYPIEKSNITNYAAKYCEMHNFEFPIDFEEMKFDMNVQSLNRTFIDKIFAICDYKIQNKIDRNSRHIYDIAKIMPMVNLDNNLKELIAMVRKDRDKCKNNPSANEKYDINQLLKIIVEERYFERDYKDITQKLLYEKVNYDDAVKHGIEIVVDLNLF